MSGHPCDFCGDPVAPFGYAPPPRLVRVRRPIWTCAKEACKAQAEARRKAVMDKADPFGDGARRPTARPATPADPDQGALF
jgi:hypothetical protein